MREKKVTNFEDALARHEKAVAELEAGELPLDKALSVFEEGVSMARVCRERLDMAEQRVLLLQKNEETGETVEVPFEGIGKVTAE